MSSSPAHRPPPKWKTALLIWLAIYPSITLLVFFFGPYLAQLPLMLRTLVMTAILVPLMVFVLLPPLQKLFGSWLRK
jgi:antibiotic biosynthesis monooxygenase (ABM) superfamily enzyme